VQRKGFDIILLLTGFGSMMVFLQVNTRDGYSHKLRLAVYDAVMAILAG
jgi:hypothetical protein